LIADLNHLGIPIFSFGIGNEDGGRTTSSSENFFWLVPPPEIQIAFYLSEVWKHWEQLRPTGIFNQMTSAIISSEIGGDESLNYPSLLPFLQESNFELVLYSRLSSETNSSASNFLVDAITLGVTVLYCDTRPDATAIVLNDLYSMAVTEFFIIGGGVWSLDSEITNRLVTKEPLESYLVTLPIPWWNDQNSRAIQDALEIHTRYARPLWMKDAGYLIALGAVDIAQAVLTNAVRENQSGKNPAGEIVDQVARL
jgi:hypothetical protein